MFNLPLIIQLPIFFFSVILHEYAHGWTAYRFGDDTAKVSGRLTLNPLPHIDPIGTVVLPLFLVLFRSPFIIGWAKPVPVTPYRLSDPRRDLIKVSAAGVLANFSLAIFAALLVRIIVALAVESLLFNGIVLNMLVYCIFINLLLGVFNLVPVPPLDGSKIVSGILPPDMSMKYEMISHYGFIIILVLVYTGILWRIIIPIVRLFLSLLLIGVGT